MDQQPVTPSEATVIDVLIVGAGPTGLVAAIALTQRGITCRLIDKAEVRSPYTKAMAIHARTLEILELLSAPLADMFVRTGYTAPGSNFSAGNAMVKADILGLDTSFPFVLFIPQDTTEALLERYLHEAGMSIERGVAFMGLQQDSTKVRVQLQHADGQNETVQARYVLGCDGAHSGVRHALDLPFEGKGYPWTAFLADVKVESTIGKNGLNQFSSERGLAVLMPFQDDYTRISTIDTLYQDRTVHDELTLAELQESVSAIIPVPIRVSEPRWLTRWSAQLRQVARYQVGRVFVVGDAAHIHSPAGGQGLNTGVQDAYNIAWKLALVLRREAPESLLESYHTERHRVGQQILHESDLMLRSVLVPNNIKRTGRNFAMKTLMPIPVLQHMMSEKLSGIGISYRSPEQLSLLNKVLKGRQGKQAGDRVPDLELKPARLTAETSTSVRLYELLSQAPYSLLIELQPEKFAADRAQIVKFLHDLQRFSGEAIKLYAVFEQGTEAITHDLPVTTMIDFKQHVRRKLGVQHGDIVLIRPDGHLALRASLHQLDPFLEELAQWVTSSPSEQLIVE